MPTTRRRFLAVSSVGSAAMFYRSPAMGAEPRGAKEPAPPVYTPHDAQTERALASSPVRGDFDIPRRAVEVAITAGATYADARLVLLRRERIGIRDARVQPVVLQQSYGLGVRVLVDGGWGYGATPVLSARAVMQAAQRAVRSARDQGALRKSLGQPLVEMVAAPAVKGQWVTPHEIDPFDVAPVDKAAMLLDVSARVGKVAGVSSVSAAFHTIAEDKFLVTSDGSEVHQILMRVMPELEAVAVDQRKGGFASRRHEAPAMLAGWEYLRDLRLADDAERIGMQARQKLYAPRVKPGPQTVVLAPSNLWLTIHESIGHSTELDRAMGLEADLAGTSFIRPTDAGTLQIGREGVNLVADRTQPGGLATVGWDDEGVAAQRWDIVRDGMFVGWQTTRDQAGWIGHTQSRGCCYGEGHEGVPFQRMPNISLQPGSEGYTTEDLINATDDGIYITGRGSWSIDQQRYNFQFSGQTFWKIKRGRLVSPLRDVAYQANSIDFWRSCDMLGGEGTYRLGGTLYDGKGQPTQLNAVSHGCPPARFTANIINTGGGRP